MIMDGESDSQLIPTEDRESRALPTGALTDAETENGREIVTTLASMTVVVSSPVISCISRRSGLADDTIYSRGSVATP